PIACQKATEKPPTPLPQQQEQQQAIPGSGEPRNKPATPIKYRPSPMYTSCMAWDSHTTKQAVSTPLLDGVVKAEVKVVKLPDPPAPQMCVSLPQPPVEQAGADLVVLPTTPATVLPTKAPAPQINPNNSAGTPSENPIQSEFFDLAEHY
uniref:SH3 domain-containing protein n=1 Tax=Haemonchus contortus TaxID=6289 RepID=A0A7I4XXD0_HAECO